MARRESFVERYVNPLRIKDRVSSTLMGPAGSSSFVPLLRVLLIAVYAAVAVVAAIIIWELAYAWGTEADMIAWSVAGLCCCIAVPLPLHDSECAWD